MAMFKYRSKGSVGDWSTNEIEAASKEEAQAKLDETYGIQRDAEGKQTNGDMITVEFVGDGA